MLFGSKLCIVLIIFMGLLIAGCSAITIPLLHYPSITTHHVNFLPAEPPLFTYQSVKPPQAMLPSVQAPVIQSPSLKTPLIRYGPVHSPVMKYH